MAVGVTYHEINLLPLTRVVLVLMNPRFIKEVNDPFISLGPKVIFFDWFIQASVRDLIIAGVSGRWICRRKNPRCIGIIFAISVS